MTKNRTRRVLTPPLAPGEKAARKRLGDLEIDLPSMAAVSNVFRVANAAGKYFERLVLREYNLSFSGFTVMWVLWINGPTETRHLVDEATITKGTLTGVLKTLECLEYVTRATPEYDRRLTVATLTTRGKRLLTRVFPKFNQAEIQVTASLGSKGRRELTIALRTVLAEIEYLETQDEGGQEID